MKRYFRLILACLLAGTLCLNTVSPALAAESPAEIQTAAAYLQQQGVMVGDANGDMRLNDGLNRMELAVLLTRLHGGAETNPHNYTWACYFTDVPQWAMPYVGYCTAMLLVSGYGNQIYGAYDPVTPAAACTVILRACGYEDSEDSVWSYTTACSYAASLGWISQSTAQAPTITRGEMAVLIYRALQGHTEPMPEPEETVPVDPEPSAPQDVTASPDAAILTKTITQPNWSREDFSAQANPAIFTGYYTRGWYNAIRQSIVDRETILAKNNEKNFNPEYRYAHTLAPDQPYEAYHAFSDLLGRLKGVGYYSLGAEPYTLNQYEYPGYTIVKICRSETAVAPLAFIQPKLVELSGKNNREKVVAFNNYLCQLLDYGTGTGGVTAVFSDRAGPALGQCGAYTNAFSFLCDAAGIPCIIVKSENHSWNEVYVDGQWLTVDVTFNDGGSVTKDSYLLTTRAARTDVNSAGTRFAKELLVPGSTN